MKFKTAPDFLDVVVEQATDLYCPEASVYVFRYSEDGDICWYDIDQQHAYTLQTDSIDTKLFWSEMLGYGGHIIEQPESCLYWNESDSELEWHKVGPNYEYAPNNSTK